MHLFFSFPEMIFFQLLSHFFSFPSFTPLPSLLSCHVSLTSVPALTSHFLSSFLIFLPFPVFHSFSTSIPFMSLPIFLFDLTSFSYSHVLSLRLILSSSQASLLFLLSCLTSFALFLSHLTSFPLNSPSPNYHNSTHSESNKRLMQMMCGLSDMLLWCEREQERERECSVQLEGAFSARFCPFREYDITHREFPAACIFGHNVPRRAWQTARNTEDSASFGEEHFNVTSTRLATCTLQIHTGFDEQTDGWDTMQCILGDGRLSWNQYTALWVRVWIMPSL